MISLKALWINGKKNSRAQDINSVEGMYACMHARVCVCICVCVCA